MDIVESLHMWSITDTPYHSPNTTGLYELDGEKSQLIKIWW